MSSERDNPDMGDGAHRFRVTVERQKLEEFNRAISRTADSETNAALRVPLTFPAVWYGMKDVQDCILETVGRADDLAQSALLHLEQTIDKPGRLEVGETYNLDIRMDRPGGDNKLKVFARVSNLREEPLVIMTSLFAVVHAQGHKQ